MSRVATTPLPRRRSPRHARSRRCKPARALAGDRVLFGGWDRTHTRRAVRPSSPVIAPVRCRARGLMSAAACTNHRLDVGGPRRKPTRAPGSVCRDRHPLRAGRSPSHRLASCACASSAANLTPTLRVVCGSSFTVRVGAHRPLDGASANLAPPALRRPAGADAPPGQPRRRPVLPAVLRQRLSTPARAVASATPALHPDEAFKLPQLALAEPPGRRVHDRRQRGQRALRVARQVRRRPALVIEQSEGRRSVGVEGVPGGVKSFRHDPCSDLPPDGGRPRPSPAFPLAGRSESPSVVSGAGPSADGMHRSRRALSGVPPRQGQALTGGLRPALTRSPTSETG